MVVKAENIQAGDVVKIRKEFEGDDRLHMVVEWNQNRGFIVPIDWKSGSIVPRELVRQEMIEHYEEMDDAEYLHILGQLGFGRIGTGGGCDALSKSLPDASAPARLSGGPSHWHSYEPRRKTRWSGPQAPQRCRGDEFSLHAS
jgi:hypothetical protein